MKTNANKGSVVIMIITLISPKLMMSQENDFWSIDNILNFSAQHYFITVFVILALIAILLKVFFPSKRILSSNKRAMLMQKMNSYRKKRKVQL